MSGLRLSDVTNILGYPYQYSIIVSYLRFLSFYGRGTKVSSKDPNLKDALKAATPEAAVLMLRRMHKADLLRRDDPPRFRRRNEVGRGLYEYYVPK